MTHGQCYDEQARLVKVEQGYADPSGSGWTFPVGYSSFHDFRLDEQGNWAQHQDGAGVGASFVSPTIVQSNAYTEWPVAGGSPLSFVLDETGRFVYERPVAGGGKYLYRHDGVLRHNRVRAPVMAREVRNGRRKRRPNARPRSSATVMRSD